MAVQVRKRSLETKKDSKSLVRQIQQLCRDQTSDFCPIIHLKRSKEGRGGGDGDWRRGKASCCTKESKCWWLFQGKARWRQPLHRSPDSLAHGLQEETFGKITALSLEHGKTTCSCVLCVGEMECKCVPDRMGLLFVHCGCSIIGGLSPRTMSEIHKMASVWVR